MEKVGTKAQNTSPYTNNWRLIYTAHFHDVRYSLQHWATSNWELTGNKQLVNQSVYYTESSQAKLATCLLPDVIYSLDNSTEQKQSSNIEVRGRRLASS